MATIPYSASVGYVPAMFRVKVRAIWRFLRAQPPSFWLVNFYLFLEYVRPQQIYRAMDVLPWAETTLVLATIAMVLEGRIPRLRTIAGPLLIIFALIVAASSFGAINRSASFAKWIDFYSWILIYLLITNIITTEKRFFVFTLAFLLYSFKMSQHGFRTWLGFGFGFNSWGATGAPGWFQNSGEFGIQMCVFLPIVVEFIVALRSHWRKWTRWFFYILPATALASIVATSSRGALLGAAALGVWWVARSKHRVRGLIAIAVLAVVTWMVIPAESKARFAEAGDDPDSLTRLERWKVGIQLTNEYPVLGIGYANWGDRFGGWLPHNIFIQAGSELGYTGLFSFLSLIGATFWINRRTRRLLKRLPTSTPFMYRMAYGLDGALIGYLVTGFFITVLYYPFFWINLAMTVSLHTAAETERRRLLKRAAVPRPLAGTWPAHRTGVWGTWEPAGG